MVMMFRNRRRRYVSWTITTSFSPSNRMGDISIPIPRWRQNMETLSALLALRGIHWWTVDCPHKKSLMLEFGKFFGMPRPCVFFYINNRWFQTLWRLCNVTIVFWRGWSWRENNQCATGRVHFAPELDYHDGIYILEKSVDVFKINAECYQYMRRKQWSIPIIVNDKWCRVLLLYTHTSTDVHGSAQSNISHTLLCFYIISWN